MQFFTFVTFLACSVTIAYALDCYSCVYSDRLSWSDKDCLKKPKNTEKVNCNQRSDTVTAGHYANNSSPGVRQGYKMMCGKGQGTYLGSEITVRGCVLGLAEDDKQCGLSHYVWTVTGGGSNFLVSSPSTCLCSKDKCNSAGSLTPSFVGIGSGLALMMGVIVKNMSGL